MRSAETDLAGLEDIFAEEVEASAKPEILRRGRRDVERAREQLQITAAEVDHERETKLPAKMSELADGVRSAEASLAQAEQRAQRGRLRAALDVEKATDDLDDARRASKEADGKVKAKERQVREAKAARRAPSEVDEGQGLQGGQGQEHEEQGRQGETTMSEDVEGKGGA